MAVQQFIEFVGKFSSVPNNLNIEISELITENAVRTPMRLKYSNSEETFRDMSAVIVDNFCKYCPEDMYPHYGLKAIKNVITKDVNDPNTKIQLTILIHVTELKASTIIRSALYCHDFQSMVLQTERSTQLDVFENVAKKVLQHYHVKKTINTLLKEHCGNEFSNKIMETDDIPVPVKFVYSTQCDLRGFSGIDEIFLNAYYFNKKMADLSAAKIINPDVLNQFIAMDIVTCAIHEYALIRIRQCADDFNMSTPNFLKKDLPSTDVEFGRMAETKYFNGPIDWISSRNSLPEKYCEQFLNALDSNIDLPKLPENIIIENRTAVGVSAGMDLCYSSLSIC